LSAGRPSEGASGAGAWVGKAGAGNGVTSIKGLTGSFAKAAVAIRIEPVARITVRWMPKKRSSM
jgi:hypothetical protein